MNTGESGGEMNGFISPLRPNTIITHSRWCNASACSLKDGDLLCQQREFIMPFQYFTVVTHPSEVKVDLDVESVRHPAALKERAITGLQNVARG